MQLFITVYYMAGWRLKREVEKRLLSIALYVKRKLRYKIVI